MRLPSSLAIVLLCAGCDKLLGLERVHANGDAPIDADCAEIADEDGDCVPDDVDNCPVTPNPDQAASRDGDAVGDACDPHPTIAIDKIEKFFSFRGDPAGDMAAWMEADGVTNRWTFPGDGKLVHTYLMDTTGVLQYQTAIDAPDVTIEAGFTFHAFDTPPTTAVRAGVWVDQALLDIHGHTCFITPYNNVDPALDTAEAQESAGGTRSADIRKSVDGSQMLIRLERHVAPNELHCHVDVDGQPFDLPLVTGTAWPTDDHVSIQAEYASVELRYVIVYTATQ